MKGLMSSGVAILAHLLTLLVLWTSLDGVSSQSLYKPSDPVIQLDGDTFDGYVMDSSTAWVVEFYVAWCGHCQRFVPTWLQFVRDIKDWHPIVKTAVVACNDEKNARLCTKYNIRGFPVVKYFPPGLHDNHPHSLGRKYDGRKTGTSLRQTTIDLLTRTQGDQRSPVTADWPVLKRMSTAGDLISGMQSGTRYAFVIVESKQDPYLGRKVILDLIVHYPAIVVTRVRRQDAAQLGMTSFPALYQYWQDGQTFRTSQVVGVSARADMVRYLKDLAPTAQQQRTTPPTSPTTTQTNPQTSPIVTTAGPSDGLHMQDLESSLYYSLWVEVPNRITIKGAAMDALKEHIAVLSKYHPGEMHVVNFLTKVNHWLGSVGNSIGGDEWRDSITAIQDTEAYIPPRVLWTGCLGSQPRFRGYPCSLWMTFHSLTVNAVDVAGTALQPQEVLSDMKKYLRHFMGCRECADNFGVMAETMENEVHDHADSILWLWNSHNKVNNRLHGDASEDPGHPKFQFPREGACNGCWLAPSSDQEFQNHNSWDNKVVLPYLRWFYRKSSIIKDALPYTFTGEPADTTTPFHDPVTSSVDTTVITTSTLPPRALVRSHATTQQAFLTTPVPCPVYQTNWSPCSMTCDTGTSTRLSNQNPECQTKLQVRLCNMRPCATLSSMRQYTRNCPNSGVTFRISNEEPLRYGNCRTQSPVYGSSQLSTRVCGICPGWCCFPSEERTVEMNVNCGGHRGRALVQIISRCQCLAACPDHYQSWFSGIN